MIKVAISGAETPIAGELIRILVNHPDVEIVALIAPGYESTAVQSIHHGLLGEEKMSFTSSFRPDSADVLFITEANVKTSDYNKLRKNYPELKVIALNPYLEDEEIDEVDRPIYALPEINRKALVRGGVTAVIPSPLSSLVLVPLYPLAQQLILNDDLLINISAPEDLLTEAKLIESKHEIIGQLKSAQKSFEGKVELATLPPTSKRGIEMTTELKSPLDLEHLMKAFDIYDDHNFSFAVTSPVKLEDVKGTEKVIVSLSLSKEGILHIHSVADGRLRGSAGEAVHVMNLLFGLHEKTGLYLKPYAY